MFVLDASTSVTKPNFQLVLDFVKNFISFADIDGGSVRVGVVVYSTSVNIQFHLDRYQSKSEIMSVIDSIHYTTGSTNTADGLRVMRTEMFTRQHGDRPGVQNMAIVVTDGVSNINSRQTLPQAQAARREGITIYAIGIGLADTRELDGIASLPVDKHRFIVQDFSQLRGLHQQVFTSICPGNHYVFRFSFFFSADLICLLFYDMLISFSYCFFVRSSTFAHENCLQR